jgi:hypothetical protein
MASIKPLIESGLYRLPAWKRKARSNEGIQREGFSCASPPISGRIFKSTKCDSMSDASSARDFGLGRAAGQPADIQEQVWAVADRASAACFRSCAKAFLQIHQTVQHRYRAECFATAHSFMP